MKQIICDGCKIAEELKDDAKAGKTIKLVELEIWEDDRDSVPRIPVLAHLCEDCRIELRNKYFRGEVDQIEPIMPESLSSRHIEDFEEA